MTDVADIRRQKLDELQRAQQNAVAQDFVTSRLKA